MRRAAATLRRAEKAGVDLAAITGRLEREGVQSFCDSYHELLACIEAKVRTSGAPTPTPVEAVAHTAYGRPDTGGVS